MFRICWYIAIAFGLILLATLGQAQEQEQNEQRQPATKQEPAQTLPIPIPVDIIEDEATAKARERREAEPRQHEKDDLVAQQGMNLAAQAMNEATQRMSTYSLYSTIFVGIGTILLIITLWLTRQANKAAQSAVEVTRKIGETQSRAYVGLNIKESSLVGGKDVGNIKFVFQFGWSNFGATPAKNVRFYSGTLYSNTLDIDILEKSLKEFTGNGITIFPKEPVGNKIDLANIKTMRENAKNGIKTFVIGRCEFEDIFGTNIISQGVFEIGIDNERVVEDCISAVENAGLQKFEGITFIRGEGTKFDII